jgi:hypothetical protein
MAMTLNGSGSITGLSAGGLPDGSIQAADLASGAAKANFGAGTVLQVVNASTSTQVTSSSSSFVDTGLTATITPSSTSSKILVLVNQAGIFANAINGGFASLQLNRSGTSIIQFGYIVAYLTSTLSRGGIATTSYLDSPNSTSALVYKTQFACAGGSTIDMQRDNSGASTITLIEIAG